VRGHSFTFGGVTVANPVVGLSKQRAGALTDIYTAGNVGAGILKRFNITWDYPHNQIFFEKNPNYAARDVFDRAGLWVNLGDKGFDVVDVFDGAPAAEAGLKVGDTILAVDGRKAGSEISLPDFRLRLRDASATKLRLDVARGGQTLHLTVALRDLV
jgi:predicted metalloprotease with PDZ domain